MTNSLLDKPYILNSTQYSQQVGNLNWKYFEIYK